jgi:hypothetical protein
LLKGFARLQNKGFTYNSLTRKGVYEWLKEPNDMPASRDPILGEEVVIAADSGYHASPSTNSSLSFDNSRKKDNKKHSSARDKGKKASHHASSSAHASSATDDEHDLGFGSLSIQDTTP